MKRVKKNEETIAWKGSFPIYFAYTPGKAGEIFFNNLKEKGTLTASRCPECGTVYLPPRIYCERCMTDVEDFFEVTPEGEVESITEVFIDVEEKPLNNPVKLALVKVEGTDGKLILRALDDLKVGDKVKIVFEEKREGSMKDIKGVKRK